MLTGKKLSKDKLFSAYLFIKFHIRYIYNKQTNKKPKNQNIYFQLFFRRLKKPFNSSENPPQKFDRI